jgi:ABC-type uncharacterized transport system auxiliary subunit
MRPGSSVVAGCAALLLSGCLFRTAEAPRFYRPGSALLAAEPEAGEIAPAATAVPIRLHGVRSAPFLRERVVWRASAVEYGLYEQRRWFELPSRYVRRALRSALEAEPGLRLSDDVQAARLEVEVLAFDEVLSPSHEAHVTLAATLRRGTERRFERAFSSRVAIAAVEGSAMAEAMGKALDDAVRKIAAASAAALAPPVRPRR